MIIKTLEPSKERAGKKIAELAVREFSLHE